MSKRERAGISHGRLFGLGLGPGDPELITLKALRLLREADIVAYPTAKAGSGQALKIARSYISEEQGLLPLVYPVTAGPGADRPDYRSRMRAFYDESAEEMAECLSLGYSVAFICAGDPFFYGSFVYWHARLSQRFETVVVPGVSSVQAASVAASLPLCLQTDVLTVIPGTLREAEIARRLEDTDAAVIMKLGRTFKKVRAALIAAGRLEEAFYVERATMPGEERVLPAAAVAPESVPYFSLVVLPGRTAD